MGHHKEFHGNRPDYKVGKGKEERAALHAREVASEPRKTETARPRDLRERLSELKQAGGGAWEELKSGVENAFGELRGSVHKAVDRVESALHSDTQTSGRPPEKT